MSPRVLAVLLVFAGTGCLTVVECTDDAQCPGGLCSPTYRICVFSEDAGRPPDVDAGLDGGADAGPLLDAGEDDDGGQPDDGGTPDSGFDAGAPDSGSDGGAQPDGGALDSGLPGDGGIAVVLVPSASGSPTYWRDERLIIGLLAPTAFTNVQLTITDSGGNTSTFPSIAADPASCTARGVPLFTFGQCHLLELSQVRLLGITENFTLTVSTSAGTISTRFTATRVRWQRDLSEPVRAAPALDESGNLYVGTRFGLHSLAPDVGGERVGWPLSLGPVASVAIARSGSAEVVYVNHDVVNTSRSTLTLLRTTGQAISPTSLDAGATSCGSLLFPTVSSLALIDAGTEVRAAVVFRAGSPGAAGTCCVVSPTTGRVMEVVDPMCSQRDPSAAPNGFPTPLNLVAVGERFFFQNGSLGVTEVSIRAATASETKPGPGTFATGLAMNGPLLLSSNGNTADGGVGLVGFQLANVFGPGVGPVGMMPWGPNAWATIAMARGILTGTSRTMTPAAVQLTDSSPTALTSANAFSLAANVLREPVISAPVRGTAELTYTLGLAGQLTVFRDGTASGGATFEWTAPIASGNGTWTVPMTLDCNRRALNGNGTLYAVSAEGNVRALIVDSQQLDPAAPWPRWQRTAGNAGNPEFALNPGCPP